MRTRTPECFRSPAWWAFVVVLALEFYFFDQFGARRHTAVYPRWHDQIEYLGDGYAAYEFAQKRGVAASILNSLTNPAAQGGLHDFFALVIFLFAGPSRSAALAVNLLALIVWQVALFAAVARTSGARPLAFAAAMLPLALAGPWQNIPGSAYDFRLDHLAMCALGTTAALAWLSDGFRSRAGATCFGLAAGLTVLTRFLTGTYLGLILVGLAATLAVGPDRTLRWMNFLRAALIAAAVALPTLWINVDDIRPHYSLHTYFGPGSALQDPQMNVSRSLAFVTAQLRDRHLGGAFILVALGGAGAFALARALRRRECPPDEDVSAAKRHHFSMTWPWLVGALFVLCPLLVLTLHPHKSEVLAGGLAPGVVMLVAAAWNSISRRASAVGVSWAAGALAAVVFGFFVHAQLSRAYPDETLADIRQINTLAERLTARAHAAGLSRPRVAIDHVTAALDAPVLRLVGYERKRCWVAFALTLPTGTTEPSDALVMERLAESDFVLQSEEAPEATVAFDRKLAAMRPQIRAWCEANLRAADRFTVSGRRMVLYQRREIPFP